MSEKDENEEKPVTTLTFGKASFNLKAFKKDWDQAKFEKAYKGRIKGYDVVKVWKQIKAGAAKL